MSTQTESATASTTIESQGWKPGVIGGLAAGLVFGALMSLMTPMVLQMGIPAMYGIEGPAGAIGWVIHMSHAAVLGVVFAAIAGAVLESDASIGKTVATGTVYGVALWVVLAVLVMPIWLSAVGFAGAPPLPNIGVESLVGHTVYGIVLGAVYATLRE